MTRPYLTILVQGKSDGVAVERLLDALSKMLSVLKDIDARNSEDGKAGLHWHITQATTNSPLTLTLSPHASANRRDTSRQVIKSCMRGFRKLESGQGIPKEFSDEALKDARSLLSGLDKGLARLRLTANDEEPIEPTLRSAALIDEFLQHRSTYHLTETTIEGSLETVTVHGGDAFDVFDQLTGTRVRCVLPDGRINSAIGLLGKRVAVSGRARLNDKGKPLSIEVDNIRELRSKGEVPKASDFEGEGRIDVTGGIESSEFIRRLRDA